MPESTSSRPIVLVAAVLLLDEDERLLIAQRPEGKSMAGLWEFPGGKVEDGETPEAALAREMEEELGVIPRPGALTPLSFASHSYDDFHLLMPLFRCRRWDGQVIAKEHQALKWVRANQLRKYPMPPADEPLISAIMDHLLC